MLLLSPCWPIICFTERGRYLSTHNKLGSPFDAGDDVGVCVAGAGSVALPHLPPGGNIRVPVREY